MANPPRLTVQDRIIADDAKDSAGRPLGDTLKKIAAASENPLDKVRNILREKDIDGTIIASSVVDDNGFLALLNDKKYVFAVYSAIDDTVAIIPYPSKEKMLYHNPWDILNFRASKYYYTRNGITERIIRFSMSKKNDSKTDGDNKLGIWENNEHIIPIEYKFGVDKNDKIIPGMISSEQNTTDPKLYRAVLKEQINVNLANSVLMHLDSLKMDVLKRNIHLDDD